MVLKTLFSAACLAVILATSTDASSSKLDARNNNKDDLSDNQEQRLLNDFGAFFDTSVNEQGRNHPHASYPTNPPYGDWWGGGYDGAMSMPMAPALPPPTHKPTMPPHPPPVPQKPTARPTPPVSSYKFSKVHQPQCLRTPLTYCRTSLVEISLIRHHRPDQLLPQ